MPTTFKLITIICEPILNQSLIELTRKIGATGFTMTEVRGEGSKKNSGEIPENKIKIEIISTATLANEIIQAVSEIFFKEYSMIIYASEISILRPEKF